MFQRSEVEKAWIRNRIENVNMTPFTGEKKQQIMQELIKSDGFEQFLIRRYASEKRFGLDGCETLIPAMNSLLDKASELGVTDAVIGMPHRGRLNVLCNVMHKPLEALLYEFEGTTEDDLGQGDVKYHLGLSKDIQMPSGNSMHLSLLPNPSHLEAVNPVLLGKVRAKQDESKHDRAPVLPVLLHGDAAFAGQGVNFECFGLAHLPAYETGGTIHIVVNNQVGFTTDPRFSRSTDYCTDLGKMVDAPIVHVNADHTEDVIRVFQMAAEYRQEFVRPPSVWSFWFVRWCRAVRACVREDAVVHFGCALSLPLSLSPPSPTTTQHTHTLSLSLSLSLSLTHTHTHTRAHNYQGNDFIIDLVCYRRFGHNEADQPAFTQPLMYQKIKDHTPVLRQYADALKAEGVIDDAWMVDRTTEHDAASMESLGVAQSGDYSRLEALKATKYPNNPWKQFQPEEAAAEEYTTGVDLDVLRVVGEALSTVPEGFEAHQVSTLRVRPFRLPKHTRLSVGTIHSPRILLTVHSPPPPHPPSMLTLIHRP
jgi:2-oxoglutarate dehydrogenase complex dehydrogenase (E1) component-like enzyme